MGDDDPAMGKGGGGHNGGSGLSTIFFSYSREDQARAVPIINLITDAGFTVWWDGLLQGGVRFSEETEQALDRAKAVVVLWSKTSIKSHWVHDESTRGRNRRILVPLSLDGSEPPLGFGQFQAIDLSRAKMSGKDPCIQNMLAAIAALHDMESPPIDTRNKAPPWSLNRRALMAGSAATLVIGGGLAAWLAGAFDGQAAANNRIAVLPFNTIGGNADQAYLSDGLATEIRSSLSQNAALQVVGQASSEAFERGKDDAVSFARKLKVGFLIDGAVQVVKDIIRVNVEIIDGKTGISRPNRTFEKPIDDVLLIQREIAGAIAAELSSSIGDTGAAKMDIGGTSNVVAYDHYLRGKDLYSHAENEAQEREAVKQFEAAIAADPQFAAAHSGRARALASVASQFGSEAEIALYQASAIASAKRAVEIAPRFADGHSALALMLFQGDLNIKAAHAPFDLSYQLGQGEAPVLARFALYCASTGRDREAVTAVERSLLLDPLNALIHRIKGTVDFAAARYPAAIEALRATLKINPALPDCHSRIGMALLAQGKDREALAEFEIDTHKWSKLSGVAIAQHRLGNAAAAKAAMDELVSDTHTVSLYQQAQILAQWGKLDEATETLKRAYTARDAGMTSARYDPMLAPIRARPDFTRLLKTMGFD